MVARLLEIVRANPLQFAAVGFLIGVVIFSWIVERSAWGTRHR